MEDQVKLVQGETLQGNKFQFLIFLNQPIGNKGGSGATVYKAIQKQRPYDQLVVKMTPYNEKSKGKLFKQIQIIRSLPDNPNIIKVLPIKINSQNFSYIFMEYCKQGTLQDLIRQRKCEFSASQIFNIFYQIISGYKILYQNNILHQDLKPANIFIKSSKYKLADFDLSIFHPGVTFTSLRQGTFPYMSPQKLSTKQYHANPKSDIYSLGIIFFKLIFKHHPYVIEKVNNLKQYVEKLVANNVKIQKGTMKGMTIEMLQLVEVVLKMIMKGEKERIAVNELVQFIENDRMFSQLRKQQIQGIKHVTEEFIIQDQKNYHIVQHSQAIFIPFFDSKQEQDQYEKQLIQRQAKKQQQSYTELSNKIQKYLISMRLIVYFFDRLSRRLHVQYLNIAKNFKQNSQVKSILQRVILSIIILAKKINDQTIKQKDLNQIFTSKQWQKYKNRKPQLLKLIQKDKQYIFLLLQDNLIQKGQCQIVQKRQIVKKGEIELSQYLKQVRKYLMQLVELRKVNIDPHNKKSLITLVHLISSLKIIDNFEEWIERYEQIQNYFRTIQTQSGDQLLNKIIEGFGQMNIQFTISLEQQEQFQQLKLL